METIKSQTSIKKKIHMYNQIYVCAYLGHQWRGFGFGWGDQKGELPKRELPNRGNSQRRLPEKIIAVRGHLGWCLVSIEGLFY